MQACKRFSDEHTALRLQVWQLEAALLWLCSDAATADSA